MSSDPSRVPEIEALPSEQRTFPPDPGFAALADAPVVDAIRENSGRGGG